ncbi:hypothetical protein JCM19233_5446 [Vibrio astriarenae]|nr:hypothetical protein JCM19233_5446 [Vibrio sp. C7]
MQSIMRERRTKKHGLGKPLAISFGIHAAVIIALLVGTDFSVSKPEPQADGPSGGVDPAIVRKQASRSALNVKRRLSVSRIDSISCVVRVNSLRKTDALKKNVFAS